jgi:hypothetical protein
VKDRKIENEKGERENIHN